MAAGLVVANGAKGGLAWRGADKNGNRISQD